jgi:hypothetical protein
MVAGTEIHWYRHIAGTELYAIVAQETGAPYGVIRASDLTISSCGEAWCGSLLPFDDAVEEAKGILAWRVYCALSERGQEQAWAWAKDFSDHRYPAVAEFLDAAGACTFNV